ncbi:hypothetical protein LTR50_007858 [Elasticomyces elasticus]|nr:hypothetical protein LTR50_007858 [Elasticomyces elasticus]
MTKMFSCDLSPRRHNLPFYQPFPSTTTTNNTSTTTTHLPTPSSSPFQQHPFDSGLFDLANAYSLPHCQAKPTVHNFNTLSAFPLVPEPIFYPPYSFMSAQYQAQNPPIRVQSSTPTPQPAPSQYQPFFPQESTAHARADGWQLYQGNTAAVAGAVPVSTPRMYRDRRGHERTPSASSVNSNGPASPYAQSASYPYIANSERSPTSATAVESTHGADEASSFYAKNLPTPADTPTHEQFLTPNSMYNPSQHYYPTAHTAMKDFVIDHHHQTAEETREFSHSSRQSVSSLERNSPPTPRTNNGDDGEEKGFKVPSTDYKYKPPALDRTISDIYQDEGFNPNSFAAAPQPATARTAASTHLSPYRSVVNERIQAANHARSHSRTGSVSRERSPFRQGSPFARVDGQRSPPPVLGTAAGARQQQKAESDALAYARHHPQPQQDDTESQTISPKDAVLDYQENDEDNTAPLFSDTIPAGYKPHVAFNSNGTAYDGAQFSWTPPTSNFFAGLATGGQPNIAGFRAATSAGPPGSNYSFLPPAAPGTQQIPPNPFSSQQYRPAVYTIAPDPPEFPAHLTSMESSISDNGPAPSSQESTATAPIRRPSNTMADTGTYTCTYHGCTLRFESPAKLQKHKRDAHRPSPRESTSAAPTTHTSSASPSNSGSSSPAPSATDMSSAAILARNSQAGPHKCARINPSTGKPCNTIFSRPYDLTRHEDTIHNARKQKVRCEFCREEKTFSRNDALTRHMRVVHPEVEFPGKRARRGE